MRRIAFTHDAGKFYKQNNLSHTHTHFSYLQAMISPACCRKLIPLLLVVVAVSSDDAGTVDDDATLALTTSLSFLTLLFWTAVAAGAVALSPKLTYVLRLILAEVLR